MTPARHFLGWDAPLLPRAARWLRERADEGPVCDLSTWTVVVPSSRAGRRLMELLAEGAGDRGLLPPEVVTPGQLPERLYRSEGVADGLLGRLARLKMLRDLSAEAAQRLVGDPPARDDLRGWWRLAGELESLSDELAAEDLTTGEVVAASSDPARWVLMHEVEACSAACLAEQGLVDRNAARRRAVAEGRCEAEGAIVLVGMADLSRLTRRFLAAVSSRITVLIAAPESEAASFDEYGGLIVEAWAERDVAVDDTRWIIADRPRDQAEAVVRAVARASEVEPISPDHVTVGLGDETLGPAVARALRLAGVPARRATGRPMTQSRPATLLAAIARYLRTRRFDDFAALLRHPDLALRAARGGAVPGGMGDWITLLDRYANDHLKGKITGRWLGESAPQLAAVYDAVHALLPEDAEREKPVTNWAEPIAQLLADVYRETSVQRGRPEDMPLIAALEAIRGAVEDLTRVEAANACTPKTTLSGAIALVLELIGTAATPELAGEPTVEIVGFLELPLDDARVLVVAGVNEGSIPSHVGADPLLPGSLRAKLGVGDNRKRLARDVYVMTSLLGRDAEVTLVSGRRGAEGDPLAPSRLVLRCEPTRMASRLLRFYEDVAPAPSAPMLTPGVGRGQPSRFHVPRPAPVVKPIDTLRVTAFRDYLACPYRFYLKHVLRLEGSDDDVVEMSGGLFGTLAHRVLNAFGQSDLRDETDADTIARALESSLEDEVYARFGDEPGAAVVLQREQLRERLIAFAHWQASHRREGWEIVPEFVERRCEATIDVDGEPFTIRGDIDRIDRHPTHGWRIIDYKTQDKGDPPETTHRTGPKEAKTWTDLQLPLYRELARSIGCVGPIELGYVTLPRDLADVRWCSAGWSDAEVDDAVERARAIVRAIRTETFWPPSDPPAFEDDFVGVCFDRIRDRAAALQLPEGVR